VSEHHQDSRRDHDRRRPTRPTQRLEALSDGVFAVAITLLVLDLAVPATTHSERHLLDAVADQWPGLLGYVVSFSTVGALWLGHNAITDYLDRADATILRLNLLVLLFVSFLPFPTRLVAEYVTKDEAERVAVTIYGLTLLVSVAVLSLLWRYAMRSQLIRPDANDEEITLLTKRLTPGLGGYIVLVVVGLFVPIVAVVGYFLIALYLLIPLHLIRHFRLRRSRAD
jgi:TMEM175 potassium channel family protein